MLYYVRRYYRLVLKSCGYSRNFILKEYYAKQLESLRLAETIDQTNKL